MRAPYYNLKFSSIVNQSDDSVLDFFIDGDIVDAPTQEFLKSWWGDDTTTSYKSMRDALLNSTAKRINIHINSGGGMMADAFAMHDFIKEQINNGKDWHTYGKGMVCSAATYPLLAPLTSNKPENMHISGNCFHMIHNASGYIGGSVDEIESYAKTIRKFNNCARDLYANCFGKPAETISTWMNAETWWTGQDMVNMGLIKPENCGPEENGITNKIPAEKWPFNNTAILNTINSSITKPKNKGMKKNKIVDAVEQAFKKYFTNGTTLQTAKPEDLQKAITDSINAMDDDDVDQESISNAVNAAMKGDAFNAAIGTAVSTALTNLLGTEGNAISTAITNGTKDFVNKTELDKVKNDLSDKIGTPRIVKNQSGKKPAEETAEDIMDTEGISWNVNKD